MYFIVVLFVFQALIFLFRNNSISECAKKKPLVLIAPIASFLAPSNYRKAKGTRERG